MKRAMRSSAAMLGAALAAGACAYLPAEVAAPGTLGASLEAVGYGANVDCMQRGITLNLLRNKFRLTETQAPGQIVADKHGNRSIYALSQHGDYVRVVLDLYVIGKDGRAAPMAASEVTPIASDFLRNSVDAVADVCRRQSPMGGDTFSIKDLR
ncbi:MAG: hypothetical protein LCH93_07100 [Proteobacteria bacterium]|nr:hypothetical protein [Pseudomonadota bacterium]